MGGDKGSRKELGERDVTTSTETGLTEFFFPGIEDTLLEMLFRQMYTGIQRVTTSLALEQ